MTKIVVYLYFYRLLLMASWVLSTPKLIKAPIKTKVFTGGTTADLLAPSPEFEKLYPYTFLDPNMLETLNTNMVKAFASFLPRFGR